LLQLVLLLVVVLFLFCGDLFIAFHH